MFKRGFLLASLLCICFVSSKAQTITAYIGYTVAKSCTYQTYTFTDSSKYTGSLKSGIHSIWYWPGGATDTGEVVTHTFSSTGANVVKLVVVNTKDLIKDSTTRTINLYFTGVNSSFYIFGRLCQRSELKFIHTDSNIPSNSTWQWAWGDGTFSASSSDTSIFVYQKDGSYNVSLKGTTPQGCVSLTSKNIVINKSPIAKGNITSHCQDSFITFDPKTLSTTNGIPGLTYSWTFLDTPVIKTGTLQTTIKRFYAKDGLYPLKFGITNAGTGCSDTQNTSFIVYSKPRVKIKYYPVCQDSLASFQDSTSVPYFKNYAEQVRYWNFYDTNHVDQGSPINWVGPYGPTNDTFQYGFQHGGYFLVRLAITTGDGCKDTTTQRIYVNPTPTPKFFYKKTCMDSATQFSDSSTVFNGPTGNQIIGWAWNFGDSIAKNKPSTSTLQNPGHVYKKFGYNVPVKLVAITNAGCRDSIVDSIVVYPNPVSKFVFDTGVCAKQPVTFTDNSGLPPLPPNALPDGLFKFFWDFGDGHTDTLENTTHSFADSGHYHVKFSAFTQYGCGDTVMKIVAIHPLPKPSFILLDTCERDSVRFLNTSKSAYGILKDSSYVWDFGDSTQTYFVTNPKHVFKYSGTFKVTLHATSYLGKGLRAACSGDSTILVKVIAGPHTSFTWPNSCLNQKINFVNNTASSRPGQIKYLWDFGDGSATDTSTSPSHTYTAVKNFHVKLFTSMASTGCVDSLVQFLPVAPLPKAQFIAKSACNDTAISFKDTSFLPPNYFFKRWDYSFGDGKVDSIQNPKHKYTSPGIYATKLVVTSTTGCKDSFFKTIESYHLPIAKFGNTTNCAGIPTQFTDSTAIGDSVATWNWLFSNSAKDSVQNPAHIYHNSDIQNAKLTVYTVHGCSSSISKAVSVLQQPVPTFQPVGGCNQRSITIYGSLKNGGDVHVVSFEWDFGDSSQTANTQNITHTWDSAGVYNVTLTEVSDNGCTGSVTIAERVTQLPISIFGYIGSCFGETFQFGDSSIAEDQFPSWDFGDGTTSNAKFLTHKFSAPGQYTVKMVATNQLQCPADTAVQIITVHPAPIAKYLWDTVCFGDPTRFIDSSNAGGGVIVSRRWVFLPHYVYDSAQPAYYTDPDSFLGAEDSFRAILKVTTNFGCTSSDSSQYAHVKQRPRAAFIANPDPATIQDPTVTFTNTSLFADPSKYYWDFGDGHDSHETSPTHTYNDTGTYKIVLSTVSYRGCVDTVRYTLYVTPGYSIFAPNIITVNADGKNDSWRAKGVGVVDFNVVIVDRWGQEVFRSTDIEQAWNADYNGNGIKVPEGVYVYYIKAGNFSNTDFKSLKGQITVVK